MIAALAILVIAGVVVRWLTAAPAEPRRPVYDPESAITGVVASTLTIDYLCRCTETQALVNGKRYTKRLVLSSPEALACRECLMPLKETHGA